ncbi:MAG: hypothetical protein FJ271_17615 [Planctomycetes bacterium]|nr:hypothetical protein [Planctomycetota bacterium]
MLWRICSALILLAAAMVIAQAQGPSKPPGSGDASDVELVERLIIARRDYQKSLETLRAHYLKTGDLERAKWAEEELVSYHRILKHAYKLDLAVPPPTLKPRVNIPEANKLYIQAMQYKDHGWGNDYIDNQRRAEILFQQILTQYPESTVISDVAYQLGDLYESKAYKLYRLAAAYFERCFQWSPTTQFDARTRAARLYDRQLQERGKAIELYRQVTEHEIEPKRITEAKKRLADLSGSRIQGQ